jgi:Asp-tRNA(Asn)/Glu-tRNA(Gln) amidotransferase A subunit family amidase
VLGFLTDTPALAEPRSSCLRKRGRDADRSMPSSTWSAGRAGPTVPAKDVIDVARMPTTAASRILHRVPDRDASASPGCERQARGSSAS